MEEWSGFAIEYDPVKAGSIDGTDTEPHDRAVVRAINAVHTVNKQAGVPENTIFIARLDKDTTSETIKKVFSQFGNIKKCSLVRDIVTGFSKGYAFVEYDHESGASKAYRKANKMTIDGKSIFVDFECGRLLQGWKPRRLGGGFGGVKDSGQLRFGGRDRPFRKPYFLPKSGYTYEKQSDEFKPNI